MNESLEHIEKYINGHLTREELKIFEKRIIEDPEFASELSFYISSVRALHLQLDEDKKERFKNLYYGEKHAHRPRTLWKYMAAAAIITGMVLGVYLLYPAPTANKIAENYISKNLATLGVMMSTNADSTQAAITSYNAGRLAEASMIFESIAETYPTDAKAREYSGIVSLRLGKSDKALEHFESLLQMKELYANPGKFYVSLTLMKRNGPGDVQRAKLLLQEIIEEHGAKEQDARELLSQL